MDSGPPTATPGPADGVDDGDRDFLEVGSTLFFVADDGVHGTELWAVFEAPCTITAGTVPDTVTGTSGNDVICGSPGSDTITAKNGKDIVFAGAGDDVVSSGDKPDTLYGEDGNDTLKGGDGKDVLDGGSRHGHVQTTRRRRHENELRISRAIDTDPVLHEDRVMRNVTITLEEDTARWARIEAARRDMSVSRLIADLLREYMAAERSYESAMQDYLSRRSRALKKPRTKYPKRADLYERDRLR